MKKLLAFLFTITLFLCGCSTTASTYDIAATTLPVYTFTAALCQNTGLSVGRLITENVSCLHDYTLQVSQMRIIENSDVIVISGAGLEEFLEDALHSTNSVIDASESAHVHEGHHHDHDHEDHGHNHEQDPHIWLSPENAKIMANNICAGLCATYPEHQNTIQENLTTLLAELDELQRYGDAVLRDLTCREMITFHDGFAYFAESFDLTILESVEEESGSEASAAEIIHLAKLIDSHDLPAIFTETNGSDACASIIQAECGIGIYSLDMAMSSENYFDSMYHNIDTVKEALG